MSHMQRFASQFGISIGIDENLIVQKQGRYFLLTSELRQLLKYEDFFYAGRYLGKVKKTVFFPSFNLLTMLAERKDASRIFVDEKSEWLFIVGRDIFRQGIKKVTGSKKKGSYTLVMSQYGECLGFGRILSSPDEEKNKQTVVVKNISDIGDFLRRERRRPKYRSYHRYQKA